MMAANADPILGCGEQKAAENRPAEAEEHLMGMPAQPVDRACGQAAAGENLDPDERQQGAGCAAEQEEGTETDQPERMTHNGHDAFSQQDANTQTLPSGKAGET